VISKSCSLATAVLQPVEYQQCSYGVFKKKHYMEYTTLPLTYRGRVKLGMFLPQFTGNGPKKKGQFVDVRVHAGAFGVVSGNSRKNRQKLLPQIVSKMGRNAPACTRMHPQRACRTQVVGGAVVSESVCDRDARLHHQTGTLSPVIRVLRRQPSHRRSPSRNRGSCTSPLRLIPAA
jgi:hypothetical protein